MAVMPGCPGPLGWVAAPTPAVQRSPLAGACDPPVPVVACLQHQALRPLLDWSAAGPVPGFRTSPVVLDRAAGPRPGRRNGKRGPAESRTAPAIRNAWTLSGSQVARNAVRSAHTAIRWTARVRPVRDAGAATASPGGRLLRRETEGVCPPRTRVRRPATGRHRDARCRGCAADRCRGAAVTGRRPARPCDQGVGPSHGPATRQRGTEGLSRRAAIYDAARQDDARLSYNQCQRVLNSAIQSFSIMRSAIQSGRS